MGALNSAAKPSTLKKSASVESHEVRKPITKLPMIAMGTKRSGQTVSSASWVPQPRRAKAQLLLMRPAMTAAGAGRKGSVVHSYSRVSVNNEGEQRSNPIRPPAFIVDDTCKHEAGALVRRRGRRYRDEDHDKGDQTRLERVEAEDGQVGDFVRNDNVPGCNHAGMGVSVE